MLITNDRLRPSTPVRSRSPHSRMMAASNTSAVRSAMTMSGTPGKAIRGPGAGAWMTPRPLLPSAVSAYASASCDPIESPSGRACEERTNRCRTRMASVIRSSSGARLLVWIGVVVGACMNVAEDLLDALLAGDRFIVHEYELRHAFQPQPRADLPPEERGRALERARARAPRLLVTERRIEDARLLDVVRHLDARQRHEADARVVHFAREQLRQLGADLIGDAVGPRALRHDAGN